MPAASLGASCSGALRAAAALPAVCGRRRSLPRREGAPQCRRRGAPLVRAQLRDEQGEPGGVRGDRVQQDSGKLPSLVMLEGREGNPL